MINIARCVVPLVVGCWALGVQANTPCPPGAKTGHFPWLVSELMNGDLYGNVYLNIDAKGRPMKCSMGQTNISRDYDRYLICNAFMEQWRTAPPAEYVKGKPSTEKRSYVSYGPQHQKAEREARKKFFKDNPNERPSCYPEY
jgi:hypothetical protein